MGELFYAAVAGPHWMWAAFAASTLLTVVHAAEEVIGEGGPLWNEFGRIARVKVPAPIGFLGVAVILPLVSVFAAMQGYVNGMPLWASVLCGIRLGDTLFSHVGLWAVGVSRPNPGLYTALFFAVEGGLILYSWQTLSWPAVLLAAASFAAVLPTLAILRASGGT